MLKFNHVEQNLFLSIQELTKEESVQIKGGDNPGMGSYSPGDKAGSTSFYSNSTGNYYSFTSDGSGNASMTTYAPDGSSTTIYY